MTQRRLLLAFAACAGLALTVAAVLETTEAKARGFARERRARFHDSLPGHAALQAALAEARAQDNGGFNLDMWGHGGRSRRRGRRGRLHG